MGNLRKLLAREATLLSVIVFWLSLASISFLFLTDESEEGSLFIRSFGTVSYAKSSVRRKRAAKFSWFSVEKDSQLAKNDSIKTGPDSAVVIDMDKGGSLEIGENSLVILKDADSITNNFIRGSLIIRDQNGDRKINVDDNGNKVVEVLSYRWTAPQLQQDFVVAPGARSKVLFKWNKSSTGTADATEILFELSTNSTFLPTSVVTKKIPAGTDSVEQELKGGKYFYHLKDATGKLLTETRSVTLKELKALDLNPVEVFALDARSDLQASWTPPTNLVQLYTGGTHELEISRDENFFNAYRNVSIRPTAGTFTLTDMDVGNYYGRIRSQVRGQEYLGATAPLRVRQTAKLGVEMLAPYSNAILDIGKNVEFQWATLPTVSNSLKYALEVRDDEKPILSENLTRPTFTWLSAPEGKYFAKVLAYNGEKKVAETRWVPFAVGQPRNLVLKFPRNGEGFSAWPSKEKIRFQWDEVKQKNYANYRIEFSATEDFAKIDVTQSLKDKTFNLPYANIKEGTYYWRVKGRESSGAEETSKTYNFNYSYPKTLAATPLRDLKNEFNLSKEKLPAVKWDEVEEAVGYTVEIVQESEGGRAPASIVQQDVQKTRFQLPNLKEGRYQVSLWPIDPAQRRGEAFRKTIVVKYGDLLKAPKLRKPEVE